ncbi:DUF4157 domain-containing protein [Streptomyces roseifaciens]
MDPATRSRMEKAFSYDFGGVRVHDGAHAELSERCLCVPLARTGRKRALLGGHKNPHTSAGTMWWTYCPRGGGWCGPGSR